MSVEGSVKQHWFNFGERMLLSCLITENDSSLSNTTISPNMLKYVQLSLRWGVSAETVLTAFQKMS